MPVVLISWDSANKTQYEITSVVDKFDLCYIENRKEALALFNNISYDVKCEQTFIINDLGKDHDALNVIKTLYDRFTELKSGNVLIISHQSFFKTLNIDVEEWQPRSLFFESF
jgi:hypothetical protein